MKVSRAAWGFGLITVAYLALIIGLDAKSGVFARLPTVASVLAALAFLAMASILLRFCRWRWLLRRTGYRIGPGVSLVAYLSGFAFTATPGKVGELVRIRYFQAAGVPPFIVVGAFVFERVLDLLAVLALASLGASDFGLFVPIALFVLLVLGLVVICAGYPGLIAHVGAALRAVGFARLSSMVLVLRDGLQIARIWMNPLDLMVSAGTGLLAWSCQAGAFVWLLFQFDISVPTRMAFSIYPMAMLAGAASMLPGGLGSTEAAIVALLSSSHVPFDLGVMVAVCIRLSTLWLAIGIGLVAIVILEMAFRQHESAFGEKLRKVGNNAFL